MCLCHQRGDSHNIWTDDDMGGAGRGIPEEMGWEAPKGFSVYALALALAVLITMCSDQASPTVKAGPAFQVPSAPRVRIGRNGAKAAHLCILGSRV